MLILSGLCGLDWTCYHRIPDLNPSIAHQEWVDGLNGTQLHMYNDNKVNLFSSILSNICTIQCKEDGEIKKKSYMVTIISA